MEEFPSNSHKIVEPPEPEPKKIEKIVEGTVVRRKKSWQKRFFVDYIRPAVNDTIGDVLIPAVRDTIVDFMSQGLERLVYGEVRAVGRRGPRHNSSNYTNYSNYSRYQTQADRRPMRPNTMSRRGRANHDFDEIILKTRGEAEEVIDRLFDLIEKYGTASVADFYEMVGEKPAYTDDKYGWHSNMDLRKMGATRLPRGQGYLLDLPETELLER